MPLGGRAQQAVSPVVGVLLPNPKITAFGDPATRAAHQATKAIPIIAMSDDIVGSGPRSAGLPIEFLPTRHAFEPSSGTARYAASRKGSAHER